MRSSRKKYVPLADQNFSVDDIVIALRFSELKAYYQPKIKLFDLELSALEVLARWEHPLFGVLAPDNFLHAVVEGGLLDEMTYSLLEQALTLQKRLSYKGIETKIAINLEPSQLADSAFISSFISQAQYHGAENNLVIEITERDNGTIALQRLAINAKKLQEAGFFLSIDDFGIGYSSLERICKIPCAEIKIDKSFVKKICTDVQYHKMVQLMINIGRTMLLNVVAEGIESLQQLNLLQSLGCQEGQGYLFSAAMSSERVEEWCGHWSGHTSP